MKFDIFLPWGMVELSSIQGQWTVLIPHPVPKCSSEHINFYFTFLGGGGGEDTIQKVCIKLAQQIVKDLIYQE